MVFLHIELLVKGHSDHKQLVAERLKYPPKLDESGKDSNAKGRNKVVYTK